MEPTTDELIAELIGWPELRGRSLVGWHCTLMKTDALGRMVMSGWVTWSGLGGYDLDRVQLRLNTQEYHFPNDIEIPLEVLRACERGSYETLDAYVSFAPPEQRE